MDENTMQATVTVNGKEYEIVSGCNAFYVGLVGSWRESCAGADTSIRDLVEFAESDPATFEEVYGVGKYNPDLNKEMRKILEDTGTLPTFAFPGGYRLLYLTSDGDILCSDCAIEMAKDIERYDTELPQSFFTNWEGPGMSCDQCDKHFPSEYGDPDEGDED